MHCVAARLRVGLHAEGAAQGRERRRRVRRREVRRLPLLPDRLPVQRPEVRVGEGGAADREVRALPAPLRGGEGARLRRGLPARRGHRPGGAAPCSPRRAAASPSGPDAYLHEDLRRDRRRRDERPLPLAGRRSRPLGLPALGTEPAPALSETIQHGIYQGFAAPRRAARRPVLRHLEEQPHAVEGGAAMTDPRAPGGGQVPHPGDQAHARAVGARHRRRRSYRFTQGLGAATAMNDGYPWGIWIAFDVVVGTGARERRLRDGAPRLRVQQGALPPARAPRARHELPRLLGRRGRGRLRPRPLLEHVADPARRPSTGTAPRSCSRSPSA